jgi:Fe-S-cluster containining protein
MNTQAPKVNVTQIRTAFGFDRTVSTTSADILNCKHMPGMLAVNDVQRMANRDGPVDNVLTWAESNLRASPGGMVANKATGKTRRVPTLVPARDAETGHCTFFDAATERCTIHEIAPFGCAFFDASMSAKEAQARSLPLQQQLIQAWAKPSSQYVQVWHHLKDKGLTAPGPNECRETMLALTAADTRKKTYKKRKRGSR